VCARARVRACVRACVRVVCVRLCVVRGHAVHAFFLVVYRMTAETGERAVMCTQTTHTNTHTPRRAHAASTSLPLQASRVPTDSTTHCSKIQASIDARKSQNRHNAREERDPDNRPQTRIPEPGTHGCGRAHKCHELRSGFQAHKERGCYRWRLLRLCPGWCLAQDRALALAREVSVSLVCARACVRFGCCTSAHIQKTSRPNDKIAGIQACWLQRGPGLSIAVSASGQRSALSVER
jgi:hypothetical protein